MLRVLVMGDQSLLAGAMISNLAQETTLKVHWLPEHTSDMIFPALPDNSTVMIVVEEGTSHSTSISAHNPLWDFGSLDMIMISSQTNHLHKETIA